METIKVNDDIMLYGFPPRYGFDFLNFKKPKFYIDIEGKRDPEKEGNDNEQSRKSQE